MRRRAAGTGCVRLARRGLAGLGVGAAALCVGSAAELRAAQAAAYRADLSFPLPARGLPGGAEDPTAIAVAPDGRVHVLDRKSGRVYLFTERGQYQGSYPDGNGRLPGPIAMALDARGRSFVLDGNARQVIVFGPDERRAGEIGRPGNAPGELRRPVDLAVDAAGYVYVLDAGSRSILIYSLDGVLVREAAFEARVPDPRAIAVGRDGAVYVADGKTPSSVFAAPPFTEWPWRGPLDRALRSIPIRGGTVADPSAIVATPTGWVLVLDRAQGRLWRADAAPAEAGAPAGPLYGGPGRGPGAFEQAVEMTVAASDGILILDARIRKLERVALAGAGGAVQPALELPIRVTLGNPQHLPGRLLEVRVRGEGTDFVFEASRRGVSRVSSRASAYTTAYGDSATARLPDPQGLKQDYGIPGLTRVGGIAVNDAFVIVSDPDRNRFVAFTFGGDLVGSFGDAYRDPRRLVKPQGVAFFPDGRLLVADLGQNLLKVFSPDLVTLLEAQPFTRPAGVAVDPNGVAYAWAEDGTSFSRRDPATGRWARVPGPVPERVAGAAFDPTGNVFVLNRTSHQVEVFQADGKPLLRFGQPGRLRQPSGLFLDGGGNVYVVDEGLNQTFLYHWHVALPAPTGVAVRYGEEGAVISWTAAGPLAKGYHVYAVAEDPRGHRTSRLVGFVSEPRSTLQAQAVRAGDAPITAVRIATVSSFGTEGEPGPAIPVPGLAARATFQGGDAERAVEFARRAVEQARAAGDPASELEARWLALNAAVDAARYDEAAQEGETLRPMLGPARSAALRALLARAYLGRGDHRAAANQLILLAADSAGRALAAQPDVQALSFRVARVALERLDTAGALGFLRNYAIALPPGDLRDRVQDTLAVTDTRAKLATGLRTWRDLEYGEAVRQFEALLQNPAAGLSPEQRVLTLQLLSATYYSLGRREDARRTYLRIFEVDPNFDLRRQNEETRRRHGLTIYNDDMLRYFEQARR